MPVQFLTNPVQQNMLKKLKKFYDESLILGGSGVDISMRLPQNVEKTPADYTLYPELGNRAIGFLTRGCPFNCPFCLVPEKEGNPRQVSDLNSLLQGKRDKLILLDDKILSHPSANYFLEELASHRVMVNFIQTLDINLIDKEKAKLLKKVNCSNSKFTRKNFHFSLNDNKRLEQIKKTTIYSILLLKIMWNSFVCMVLTQHLPKTLNDFFFYVLFPGPMYLCSSISR